MSARGTVIKRGAKWAVVLDLGRDLAGNRLRQWHSGFDSERAAEKARTALLKSLDEGTYVKPTKDTVGAFLAAWLPAIRSTVRPTTASLYATLTNAYLVPRLGGVRLAELSPAHLNALYADLLRAGRRQGGGGGLSPKTVRNVHGTLHRALTDAVRWGVLARNVAELADPPKVPSSEASVWTNEDLRAFLAAVEADRLAALWRLAAMTGMRRGELCGLRWSDVDLPAGRVRVSQVAALVGSELTYTEPKTRNSRRSISLDPATVAGLRAHRSRQLEERLAWGPAWTDTGLVFTHEDGTALRPPALTRSFARLAEGAGLPALTLHGLRHSHITSLLRAGQPIRVVSARAGHSSPAITLSVYAHVLPGDDEAAAAAAAAAVDTA